MKGSTVRAVLLALVTAACTATAFTLPKPDSTLRGAKYEIADDKGRSYVETDHSALPASPSLRRHKRKLNGYTRPLLAAYWETWSPDVMALEDVPHYIDIVLIAFVVVKDDGVPEDTIPGDQAALKRGIERIHHYGNKVILSIGGAANCANAPTTLHGDKVFGVSGVAEPFATAVVSLIHKYDLDGIDLDYECINYDNSQNTANALEVTKKIREKLPEGKELSWAAFSNVGQPGGYVQQTPVVQAVQSYLDLGFWMSYNVDSNPAAAQAWYTSALGLYTSAVVPVFGGDCSRVLFGTCSGAGCGWGPGPSDEVVLSWANYAKQNNCGGLFTWDLQKELLLSGDIDSSILKKIADIFYPNRPLPPPLSITTTTATQTWSETTTQSQTTAITEASNNNKDNNARSEDGGGENGEQEKSKSSNGGSQSSTDEHATESVNSEGNSRNEEREDTSTGTATAADNAPSSLSAGAIAGVAVASVAALVLLVLAISMMGVRATENEEKDEEGDVDGEAELGLSSPAGVYAAPRGTPASRPEGRATDVAPVVTVAEALGQSSASAVAIPVGNPPRPGESVSTAPRRGFRDSDGGFYDPPLSLATSGESGSGMNGATTPLPPASSSSSPSSPSASSSLPENAPRGSLSMNTSGIPLSSPHMRSEMNVEDWLDLDEITPFEDRGLKRGNSYADE